jgi:hypothetical protein
MAHLTAGPAGDGAPISDQAIAGGAGLECRLRPSLGKSKTPALNELEQRGNEPGQRTSQERRYEKMPHDQP